MGCNDIFDPARDAEYWQRCLNDEQIHVFLWQQLSKTKQFLANFYQTQLTENQTLESEMTSNDNDVSNLKASVTNILANIDNLQTSMLALQTNYNNFKLSVDDTLNLYQTTINGIVDSISTLTVEYQALQNRVGVLESTVNIDALNEIIRSYQQILENTQSMIDDSLVPVYDEITKQWTNINKFESDVNVTIDNIQSHFNNQIDDIGKNTRNLELLKIRVDDNERNSIQRDKTLNDLINEKDGESKQRDNDLSNRIDLIASGATGFKESIEAQIEVIKTSDSQQWTTINNAVATANNAQREVCELESKSEHFDKDIIDLNGNINSLNKKVDNNYNEVTDKINNNYDDLTNKINNIEIGNSDGALEIAQEALSTANQNSATLDALNLKYTEQSILNKKQHEYLQKEIDSISEPNNDGTEALEIAKRALERTSENANDISSVVLDLLNETKDRKDKDNNLQDQINAITLMIPPDDGALEVANLALANADENSRAINQLRAESEFADNKLQEEINALSDSFDELPSSSDIEDIGNTADAAFDISQNNSAHIAELQYKMIENDYDIQTLHNYTADLFTETATNDAAIQALETRVNDDETLFTASIADITSKIKPVGWVDGNQSTYVVSESINIVGVNSLFAYTRVLPGDTNGSIKILDENIKASHAFYDYTNKVYRNLSILTVNNINGGDFYEEIDCVCLPPLFPNNDDILTHSFKICLGCTNGYIFFNVYLK